MIFPKKCLGCPPFLGYICWPKVVGALLLLSGPLALLSFRRPWGYHSGEINISHMKTIQWAILLKRDTFGITAQALISFFKKATSESNSRRQGKSSKGAELPQRTLFLK